jgi:ATP-dependent Clp protease ATP-binding subunit ClpC
VGKKIKLDVLVKVRLQANLEATYLQQAHCGTEEFLVSLLADDNFLAADVLKQSGVDLAAARAAIKELFPSGDQRSMTHRIARTFNPTIKPQLSPNAERAMEQAAQEAEQRGCDRIESEHILLSLLKIESSGAARVLEHLGVSPEDVYRQMMARL